MMEKDIQKDVNSISPKVTKILDEIKYYDDIPNLYFEDLQNKVLANIAVNFGEESSIAPKLTQILAKYNSYTDMPDNYFNNLQEQVLAKVKYKNEEEGIEPIPANYFENLPEVVWQKIHPQKRRSRIIQLAPYFKWTSVAACIILISILTFNPFGNSNDPIYVNKNFDKMVNELTQEDTNALIEDWSNEGDLNYLQNTESLDLNNLEVNSNENSEHLFNELSEEDIEYLKSIM